MSALNFRQRIASRARYCRAKNGRPFAVRPANPADAQEIERNIMAICAEQEYLHTDTFVRTSEWEALLAQSIDLQGRQILLVAVAGESVIGHARLFPPWFGSKGRHVADLGIAILRPWRDIGIGTAMLGYLLEWAIRLDYLKASVEVIATNQRAINLFRKFGFVEEGRRLNHIRINDTYIDEILMGLNLNQQHLLLFQAQERFFYLMGRYKTCRRLS